MVCPRDMGEGGGGGMMVRLRRGVGVERGGDGGGGWREGGEPVQGSVLEEVLAEKRMVCPRDMGEGGGGGMMVRWRGGGVEKGGDGGGRWREGDKYRAVCWRRCWQRREWYVLEIWEKVEGEE